MGSFGKKSLPFAARILNALYSLRCFLKYEIDKLRNTQEGFQRQNNNQNVFPYYTLEADCGCPWKTWSPVGVCCIFCWYHIQGTQRPQVPQSDQTRLPLDRGRRQEDNHPSEAASCKTTIHERLQTARQPFIRGCKYSKTAVHERLQTARQLFMRGCRQQDNKP